MPSAIDGRYVYQSIALAFQEKRIGIISLDDSGELDVSESNTDEVRRDSDT